MPRTRSRLFYLATKQEFGDQCGFASTVAGNPLSEADQRAKLQLAVDAARAVWN